MVFAINVIASVGKIIYVSANDKVYLYYLNNVETIYMRKSILLCDTL